MAENQDQKPYYTTITSGEFVRHQEFVKTLAVVNAGFVPFGEATLLGINRVTQEDSTQHLFISFGTENKDDIKHFLISGSREELLRSFEDIKLKKYAEKFFYETVADPSVAQRANELGMSEIFSANLVPEDMFNNEKIPDEMFLTMLQSHVSHFKMKEDEFQTHVPQLLGRFLERLTPEFRARAEERIPYIEFHLMDILLHADLVDEHGAYNPYIGKVRVAEQLNDEDREYAFTHEMVHVLGGNKLLSLRNPYAEYVSGTEERIMKFTRSGLALGETNKFTWLNEAVTEFLTREILNKDQYDLQQGFYGFERFVFLHLLSEGKERINPELFLDAYLEDFDPATGESGQTPARKALLQTINHAYRPGFLAQLDRYIETNWMQGIVLAMLAMKTDWHQIPIEDESGTSA